jgi:SUN domain-containing protein 1/2
VSVQLAPYGQVTPTTISLEHVPSSIAHSVASAPQKLQVWGYRSPNDPAAVQLDKGDCEFNVNLSRTVQFCDLKESQQPVNIVQLRVMSNHGRKDYTCVYRFRVHGFLP